MKVLDKVKAWLEDEIITQTKLLQLEFGEDKGI